MFRKRLFSVLAALVLGFGGVAAANVQAPDEAEAAIGHCWSGWACAWRDADFYTLGVPGLSMCPFQYSYEFGLTYPTYSYTYWPCNDSATSIYNNGNYQAVWWYDSWYGSRAYTGLILQGIKSKIADLTDSGGHNDEISAGYFFNFRGTSLG
jgi:hypothetical protein